MIFTLMMILDAVFKEYEPGDTYWGAASLDTLLFILATDYLIK